MKSPQIDDHDVTDEFVAVPEACRDVLIKYAVGIVRDAKNEEERARLISASKLLFRIPDEHITPRFTQRVTFKEHLGCAWESAYNSDVSEEVLKLIALTTGVIEVAIGISMYNGKIDPSLLPFVEVFLLGVYSAVGFFSIGYAGSLFKSIKYDKRLNEPKDQIYTYLKSILVIIDEIELLRSKFSSLTMIDEADGDHSDSEYIAAQINEVGNDINSKQEELQNGIRFLALRVLEAS
jgi:hypothetical protein